jgi:SAM-dependent methyltransferase
MRDLVRFSIAVACSGVMLLAPAAMAAGQFEPHVGQAGKDVIWVPTAERAVAKMLALAQVRADDMVIDLGCGDGRIVIAAAKSHGARGVGVDLNPEMVQLAKTRAVQAGVSDRTRFHVEDIFKTDLRSASVVALYLLPELNLRLRPSLLGLAPGTRIVANAFDMGEWEADEVDTSTASILRLWIVPAKVAGSWRIPLHYEGRTVQARLDMNQQFQRVTGLVSFGEHRLRMRNVTLRGDHLSFVLLHQQRADYGIRMDYTGRVTGGRIEGKMTSSETDRPLRWAAVRVVEPTRADNGRTSNRSTP